jgi:hypothetical protein
MTWPASPRSSQNDTSFAEFVRKQERDPAFKAALDVARAKHREAAGLSAPHFFDEMDAALALSRTEPRGGERRVLAWFSSLLDALCIILLPLLAGFGVWLMYWVVCR